jgi:hypothetical protein
MSLGSSHGIQTFSEYFAINIFFLNKCFEKYFKNFQGALVANTYNSNYSGGRDQEDCGLKPTQANS